MTSQERKELTYFPKSLDSIINAIWPDANCVSEWGLFSGHTTVFNPDLPADIQRDINNFIQGFMAGNLELRERIQDKTKWVG